MLGAVSRIPVLDDVRSAAADSADSADWSRLPEAADVVAFLAGDPVRVLTPP